MDKIKQLLESKVPEDVAIGMSLLIKREKPRKRSDMQKLLMGMGIKFSDGTIHIYISYFNIFIDSIGNHFVYGKQTDPAVGDYTIIRL